MEIKTKRLVLKPFGVQYLNSTFQYASDFDTTKFMVYLPSETMEETLDFLQKVEQEWNKEKPAFYEFAIFFNEKHIGAVSLYLDEEIAKQTPNVTDNKPVGEFGWIIHKEYWNQGFATEAAKALFDFAVNSLHVNHFIAHCDAENTASYRVMEKLGMERTEINEGRKNRSSDENRKEYQYELVIG